MEICGDLRRSVEICGDLWRLRTCEAVSSLALRASASANETLFVASSFAVFVSRAASSCHVSPRGVRRGGRGEPT